MNNIDKQYQALLQDILDNGVKKGDRTGTGTISVFGRQIRHKMSEGFPLLTTKKMAWKSMVTELIWFLRGDTNIKYLVDNGCHIWDGDAYKNYLKHHDPSNGTATKEEFVELIKQNDNPIYHELGELGPIYGAQWRNWNDNGPLEDYLKGIDQITNLIKDLKANPDSRRLMVNAWNVGEIDSMVLPPCHYGFQVYTRELPWYDDLSTIKEAYINWSLNKFKDIPYAGDAKGDLVESADRIFTIGWQERSDPFTGKPLVELDCFSTIPKRAISLMWNQRSVDTFLGLPFNIASYALLLQLLGHITNMVPDELIGNLGDTHLYSNHLEQAKEQITRTPYELPTVHINGEFWLPNFDDVKVKEIGCSNTPGSFSNDFDALIKGIEVDDFILENYQSHPAIKAPLSN